MAEANPQAETIVSFVGYPSYVRLLLRRDPEYHAFVWDLGNEENVDWDAELAAGRVAARVGNKRNPDMQADLTSSMSMEEIFGTRYELVTAP